MYVYIYMYTPSIVYLHQKMRLHTRAIGNYFCRELPLLYIPRLPSREGTVCCDEDRHPVRWRSLVYLLM